MAQTSPPAADRIECLARVDLLIALAERAGWNKKEGA